MLVPIKRADIAKSRLSRVTARQRAELARAFPADCVRAALACARVRTVVAITDDTAAARTLRDLGAVVIPDEPDAGLNPALRHAAAWARQTYGDAAVAVLSGDLPALRTAELTTALREAEGFARAFLPDLDGRGTTLLTAAAGTGLEPRFGPTSRDDHRGTGAHELTGTGLDSVRHDVDTWHDLQQAVQRGVGPHTAQVLRRHRLSGVPAE